MSSKYEPCTYQSRTECFDHHKNNATELVHIKLSVTTPITNTINQDATWFCKKKQSQSLALCKTYSLQSTAGETLHLADVHWWTATVDDGLKCMYNSIDK